MITLYKFGPKFGLPDASPFCAKAELLLKIAGLDYETDLDGFNKAPKGKLPYIKDGDEIVADSTFIRLHIEKKYGFDFDAGLDARAAGLAWAAEKMCEDHLYWIGINERWSDDDNFDRGPRSFFDDAPAVIRPFLVRIVRKKVINSIKAHGMGRHSRAETYVLANRTIDAVANILGEQRYLTGDVMCGGDATVFTFVQAMSCRHFDTPVIAMIEQHKNLIAYRDRMQAEWFGEADN